MNTLEQVFQAVFKRETLPRLGTALVAERFKNAGITLTAEQRMAVETRLRAVKGGDLRLTVDLTDEQLAGSALRGSGPLQVDLNPDDFVDRLEHHVPEVVHAAVEETSRLLLAGLKRNARRMLKKRRADREGFEKRLAKSWGDGFNLLEMFLQIALEAGSEFNGESRPAAAMAGDFTFDVLTRLHARACLVASEILALLRAGHADGAHARWRLLPEIAVVGFFVKAHGNDVAERYMAHDAIESYRAATLHQEHHAALSDEPNTQEELAELHATVECLKTRFGKGYGTEWGWAAKALGKERPTFRDIERATGLAHLRPYYKLSSHNVHANPKGVLFKLGLLPEHHVLLAGPSNLGLADPAHGTAISLAQITVGLLTMRPDVNRVVICNVLMKLEREIGEAFLAVQKALDELAVREIATPLGSRVLRR